MQDIETIICDNSIFGRRGGVRLLATAAPYVVEAASAAYYSLMYNSEDDDGV